MKEFQNKTAVVTGAAQGMGAAYVRLLAQAGANVVLADVNEEKARETAQAVAGAGERLLVVKTDVGSRKSCDACARATVERFGGIDYLVNNAGLLSAALEKPLHQIDPDSYLRIISIMTHGMLWMTRAVLPSMRARGGGAIVNVSSIGSWQATGVYSLAKLGVNGLTVNLARELLPYGIRVNAVAPGTTATEGMQPIMSVEQMGQWAQSFGKPTSRVAAPEDIARVGIFLLSDAANYVAGQILAADEAALVRV
jgi:3-oxoacyl-[acyl-carrier protein] reductase